MDLFVFLAHKLLDLVNETKPFVLIISSAHIVCVDEDHVLDAVHSEVAHNLVEFEIHLGLVAVRESYLLAHNTFVGLRDDSNKEVKKNDDH